MNEHFIKSQEATLELRLAELRELLANEESGLDAIERDVEIEMEERGELEVDHHRLERLSEHHRRELATVTEALRRLKERAYGVCQSCGDDIGEARLRAIPTAALCIECAETDSSKAGRTP